MAFPLVSVIIPTYNRAHCIGNAIDSVLRQTYKKMEVIVIDDGSTDNTREILENKFGKKIIYLFQDNKGAYSARNVGLKYSHGEWIAFLDSDDEWTSEIKLETQMKDIQKDNSIVAHSTNALFFTEDVPFNLFEQRGLHDLGKKQKIFNRPLPLLLKDPFYLQSTIVKRSAVEKAGLFCDELTYMGDRLFLRQIALQGSWFVINEPMVSIYRREMPGSLSLDQIALIDNEKRFSACIATTEPLINNPNILKNELSLVRDQLQGYLFDFAYFYASQGRREDARHTALNAYKSKPCLKTLIKFVIITNYAPAFKLWIKLREWRRKI